MDEGDTFGPYRLQRLLGRGRAGEVFETFDVARARTVALRVLPAVPAGDGFGRDFRRRFHGTAELAARLTEPHVVPMHDFGEIDGRLYLDMRLVPGTDPWARQAERGRFPQRTVIEIISQVAAALDAAHAVGLVHGSLHPGNVLISGRPGSEFAHLTDLGVARSTHSAPGSPTATGRPGTDLGYAAPELIGGAPADRHTDGYGLGCLLFELLAGHRPFPVEDVAALLHAQVNIPPPRLSRQVSGLPPALDEVLARAMAKDPTARYPGAGELAAAARLALDHGAAGADTPAGYSRGRAEPVGGRRCSPTGSPSPARPPGPVSLMPAGRPPAPAASPPAASPPAASPPTASGSGPATGVRRARGRRRAGVIVTAVIAMALAAAGGFLLLREPATDPSEVAAEPAHVPGERAFLPAAADPDRDVVVPVGAGGPFGGDTAGLFGGSSGVLSCDPGRLAALLQRDPEKAAAWAESQDLTAAGVPAYITRLTAVFLRSDTAVTSHRFGADGAESGPAVLQAGTAVLVDELGVPRAGCGSGNPLTPARAPLHPRYPEAAWPGFSPSTITTIQPAAAAITEFTVVDPGTGAVFRRAAGSNGNRDR